MSKICTGGEYDRNHCEVEKMGCEGCDYYKEEGGKNDEQKISKCTENQSN